MRIRISRPHPPGEPQACRLAVRLEAFRELARDRLDGEPTGGVQQQGHDRIVGRHQLVDPIGRWPTPAVIANTHDRSAFRQEAFERGTLEPFPTRQLETRTTTRGNPDPPVSLPRLRRFRGRSPPPCPPRGGSVFAPAPCPGSPGCAGYGRCARRPARREIVPPRRPTPAGVTRRSKSCAGILQIYFVNTTWRGFRQDRLSALRRQADRQSPAVGRRPVRSRAGDLRRCCPPRAGVPRASGDGRQVAIGAWRSVRM